ncbi:hypothetical protein D3C77_414690 [compost metagenome]
MAARLSKSSRVRSIALSLAGLMGGVIAVRELLNVDLNFGAGAASASAASAPTSDGGLALLGEGGYALQTLMDRSGLADLAAGSLGGMQLFWATTGVLVALLAVGAVKLSQQI